MISASVALLILGALEAAAGPTKPQNKVVQNKFSQVVEAIPNPQFRPNGPNALRKAYSKYGAPIPKWLKEAGIQKRDGASLPVATGEAQSVRGDLEYVVPVMIGEGDKATQLLLDFDTGSSDLWVMSGLLPKEKQNSQHMYACKPAGGVTPPPPGGDAGASCNADKDCKSGLTCTNNKCAAPSPSGGNAGDSCSADKDCKSGLKCANNKCAAPSPTGGNAGDSCDADDDCNTGLKCKSKKCVATGKAGEYCSRKFPCGQGLKCKKNKCTKSGGSGGGSGGCDNPSDEDALCCALFNETCSALDSNKKRSLGLDAAPTKTAPATADGPAATTWEIHYGDNSYAMGTVVPDKVAVGAATVVGQAVECATDVSAQFASKDSGNDGLLGLGFGSINTVKPAKVKTWFENYVLQAVAAGARKSDVSVFVSELRHNTVGAYIFGAAPAKVSKWADCDNSGGWYQFHCSNGYAVGSDTTLTKDAGCETIADTGTTLLLMSDAAVKAYYAKVTDAKLDQEQGGYVFPCNSTTPDFTVSMGDEKVTIPGEFLNYAPTDETGKTCFGGLQSNGGIEVNIYGDVFLKAGQAVYDSRSDKIRFGFTLYKDM